MSRPSTFDVIIVGAGPAGSLAACLLARGGQKVLLLDRAKFPRPKVCGDFLNPRTQALWQRLGLWESFQTVPHHSVSGLCLEQNGQAIFQKKFPGPTGDFRAVARIELDDWLRRQAQQAGAELLDNTAVREIQADGRVITTHGAFQGKFVLGADGRNSLVARQVGLKPRPQKCRRVGWQTTLRLPAFDHAVHMNVFPGGYYGAVRIDTEHINFCAVLDTATARQPAEILARFFPQTFANTWRTISPINRRAAQPARDRVWLLGDAARVVEPFTGEGIFFALASAEIAADLLLKKSAATSPEKLASLYSTRHADLYRGELLVNRLTRWLLEKSRRGLTVLPILARWPGALDLLTQRVLRTRNFALTP